MFEVFECCLNLCDVLRLFEGYFKVVYRVLIEGCFECSFEVVWNVALRFILSCFECCLSVF